METEMQIKDQITRNDELILVTGASGFIGSRVLETLMECNTLS